MSGNSPNMPKPLEKAFDNFPPQAAKRLSAIRDLIYEVAGQSEEIGELTETLKWGEPAYLTEQTKSGSTIRMGYKDSDPGSVALYFNCQTTLVEDMRWAFPEEFEFVGNRAVLIPIKDRLPKKAVRRCIEMALLYHRKKVKRA